MTGLNNEGATMSDSQSPYPYAAFSGYGIEIEHMIVDAHSLDIRPIADELLREVGGNDEVEVDRGLARWSNELALHVIEMKTAGITKDWVGTAQLFRQQTDEMNARLAPRGARLLPGGMHPWMDPLRETRLWPHENDFIYQAFDRIFDCRGHGWSNLQSVHINLPFQNDAEFAQVHAACRFLLPLLPSLAASSPLVEGRRAPELDHRVEVYRHNARRVPSVTGLVIPERVYSQSAYTEKLLEKIYQDLRPLDPEGVLLEEWVNARGVIARFDRGALEIRLLDTQECPEQDLLVVQLVTRVAQLLAEQRWEPLPALQAWPEEELAQLLLTSLRDGSQTRINSPDYLRAWGIQERSLTAQELWLALIEQLALPAEEKAPLVQLIQSRTLAERLLARLGHPAVGETIARSELREVYAELADCLALGRPFPS